MSSAGSRGSSAAAAPPVTSGRSAARCTSLGVQPGVQTHLSHPFGPPAVSGGYPARCRCASCGQAAAPQPLRSPRRLASCAPRRHGASPCAAPRVQRRRDAARRMPRVARWRSLRGRRPADAGQALHHHAVGRRCAMQRRTPPPAAASVLRRLRVVVLPLAGGPTVGETYVGTAGTSTLFLNSLAAVDPLVRGTATSLL